MRGKPSINYEHLPKTFPPQKQSGLPGIESKMNPRPIYDNPCYFGSGKLERKVALITGGDSGIGRAVGIAFAKEGANVAINYLHEEEYEDAFHTKARIEYYGGKCKLYRGDLLRKDFCSQLVDNVVKDFGHLDILVNNAGSDGQQGEIAAAAIDLAEKAGKVEHIYALRNVIKQALLYMNKGGCIINTEVIAMGNENVAYKANSNKNGEVACFTRALSQVVIDRGIRVNAVSPGPIWTPLIASSLSSQELVRFGGDTPMKRAGQPFEVAPAYVYLASEDSSYVTGQVLYVNGGTL